MQEKPIIGLEGIADFLALSTWTVKKYSRQWQKEGFLFSQLVGRPPNRRWLILSYPEDLKRLLKRGKK